MNTSNSFPVCPLPCNILDAASQSACVSVCKGEGEGGEGGRGGGGRGRGRGRGGEGEGEGNKNTKLQMYNARVSAHGHCTV